MCGVPGNTNQSSVVELGLTGLYESANMYNGMLCNYDNVMVDIPLSHMLCCVFLWCH